MNVEYTGRQYEVTPAVRKQVEHGLTKLTRFLGDSFETHVILAVEKHRCRAEITINIPNHSVVGAAEAGEMIAAVGEALERIERQAVKYRARWRTIKRQPKKEKAFTAEAKPEEMTVAVGANATTAVPVVVHKFPSIARTTEAHLVTSSDSVALRPLTLEEAIKEAEFRDRDVFVFRDDKGKVKVLHRTKDGKMELIEAP
jgi:ribosome hibernation promoting factor